jgi:hypothetical protein
MSGGAPKLSLVTADRSNELAGRFVSRTFFEVRHTLAQPEVSLYRYRLRNVRMSLKDFMNGGNEVGRDISLWSHSLSPPAVTRLLREDDRVLDRVLHEFGIAAYI